MKNQSRLLLGIFAFLLLAAEAIAAPRTPAQARVIAQRKAQSLGIVLNQDGVKHLRGVSKRLSQKRKAEGESYYVFDNGNNRGFTIVSGDDLLPEVVAYSTSGSIDESHLPDAFVYYLKAYDEFASAVLNADPHALHTLREAQALQATAEKSVAVAPLLGSIQWSQNDPYNRLAPVYYQGQHAASGCVATAMAQVMMYHRWPDVLKDDIDGYSTRSLGLTVSGFQKGESIDWDHMLPQYVQGQYDDVQANAVAKFMMMCGASVKMDYGPSSAASVLPAHLVQYFGYDKETTQVLRRGAFSLTQWTEILHKELEAARPVLYSGYSTDGGHQFVCDGVDGNGLYHINWGWGGYEDGYFDLTVLNPEKGGTGSGNASDGYNRNCDMIIGIQPDNGIVDKPLVSPPVMLMAKGIDAGGPAISFTTRRSDENGTFTCKTNLLFYNLSTTDVNNMLVALGVKNADGKFQPISPKQEINLPASEQNAYYYDKYYKAFPYKFPIGRTAIYGIYSLDQGRTWLNCEQGVPVLEVEATATTLKMATPLSASLSAEWVYTDVENPFSITLTNLGDVEYNGLLNVYAATENIRPDTPVTDVWVTVPPHVTLTRSFNLKGLDGDMYTWVLTDDGHGSQVLVDGEKFEVKHTGTPQLGLVSVESNATPDDYESEKAFYKDWRVYLPRVNDDKLELCYHVVNHGEDYLGKFYFSAYNGLDYSYATGSVVTKLLKGGGETTKIEIDVPFSQVQDHTVMTYFSLWDDENSMTMGKHIYRLLNDDGSFNLAYFNVDLSQNWFYVTGVSTSIHSPETGLEGIEVIPGRGCLTLTSRRSRVIRVANISGQCVAESVLLAGKPVTLSLSAGVYIVEGKKVMVR